MEKIKILFYNLNEDGVYYFRTLTPAIHLDTNYSNEFEVTINKNFNPQTESGIDYMSTFNIVHFHQVFTLDISENQFIINKLKNNGVKVILDLDDYWVLDSKHPKYSYAKDIKLDELIINNIKLCHAVTTTTNILKSEIEKYTDKDVIVLENSIDTKIMNQFENNKTKSKKVRIGYLGGSTHVEDIKLLDGVFSKLYTDTETKDKFQVVNIGWDKGDGTYDMILNEDLVKELEEQNLITKNLIKSVSQSKGDISKIKEIPEDLKKKYNENSFKTVKRPFRVDEIAYYHYEKIFTNDYRIINDDKYVKHLKKYNDSEYNDNDMIYKRIWSKPVNKYAYTLDDIDIILAPLVDSKFNSMKSPLKMIEGWSRKIAVVCSDVAPYNVDGVDGVNCLLVPNKLNSQKHWYKKLKKIILDDELRNLLGNNLYKDFSKKYNLNKVNKNRIKLYKNICNEVR